MQEILTYFETVPTFVRTLFLVSGVFFFLLLEMIVPLFQFDYHKGKHAAINITFTLITLVVNLFGAALIVATVSYTQFHQIGVEAFGFSGPDIDAEQILMCARIWKELNLNDISLQIKENQLVDVKFENLKGIR